MKNLSKTVLALLIVATLSSFSTGEKSKNKESEFRRGEIMKGSWTYHFDYGDGEVRDVHLKFSKDSLIVVDYIYSNKEKADFTPFANVYKNAYYLTDNIDNINSVGIDYADKKYKNVGKSGLEYNKVGSSKKGKYLVVFQHLANKEIIMAFKINDKTKGELSLETLNYFANNPLTIHGLGLQSPLKSVDNSEFPTIEYLRERGVEKVTDHNSIVINKI